MGPRALNANGKNTRELSTLHLRIQKWGVQEQAEEWQKLLSVYLTVEDTWSRSQRDGCVPSAPDTTKESEAGELQGLGLTYGVCPCKGGGARKRTPPHCGTARSTAVFGVFDGHGGREVSNFKRHLADALVPRRPSPLTFDHCGPFHRTMSCSRTRPTC